jgi:hypothetical protein
VLAVFEPWRTPVGSTQALGHAERSVNLAIVRVLREIALHDWQQSIEPHASGEAHETPMPDTLLLGITITRLK